MKTIADQLLVFDNSPILLGVSKNKTLRSHDPLPPEIASFWTPLPSKFLLPSEGVWIFSGLDITMEAKICAWNMPNYNVKSRYSTYTVSIFPFEIVQQG